MRALKWILTPLALAPSLAQTAIHSFPLATSFYRTPQSAFVSGQTNRTKLELKLLRTEQDVSYKVAWDQKIFTVRPDQVLRDLNCVARVQLSEGSQLLQFPRTDAKVIAEPVKGTDAELQETFMHWARIKLTDGREGWLPQQRLQARADDPGLYVPVIATFLRHRPDNLGRIISTLPRGERLRALDIQDDGWMRVFYKGRYGYVDVNHVVGRIDFAVWAYHPKKKWVLLSHRDGSRVKTRDGQIFSLRELQGFAPQTSKGIVAASEGENLPPLRARVTIEKTEATVWAASLLDEHGEVWWRKESVMVNTKPDMKNWLSTDEILARDVFSYAVNGKDHVEGLISAKGIWKTDDGQKWQRLTQFGDEDMPVSLHPAGFWFVGSYRSPDKGKTFEPFIRWETLTQTIEADLQRSPRFLKLQKIEAHGGKDLDITVDTGFRRLQLRSSVQGNLWRVVRVPVTEGKTTKR